MSVQVYQVALLYLLNILKVACIFYTQQKGKLQLVLTRVFKVRSRVSDSKSVEVMSSFVFSLTDDAFCT